MYAIYTHSKYNTVYVFIMIKFLFFQTDSLKIQVIYKCKHVHVEKSFQCLRVERTVMYHNKNTHAKRSQSSVISVRKLRNRFKDQDRRTRKACKQDDA